MSLLKNLVPPRVPIATPPTCYACHMPMPPHPVAMVPADQAACVPHVAHKYTGPGPAKWIPCGGDVGSARRLADRLHEQQMIWLDDSRWNLDA